MKVSYKNNLKVCHITSVHNRYDNRIYQKECISLSKKYTVILLTADGKESESINNVLIKSIKPQSLSLVQRVFKVPYKLFKVGIKEKASVYHLHDPELIITGLFLRSRGKKVIYDIHEDYTTSFLHRSYLSLFMAKLISFFFDKIEKFAGLFFHKIIAEKYYDYRFPKATKVLNYPIFESLSFNRNKPIKKEAFKLLYTGNINNERGAVIHAGILKLFDDVELEMIGHCSEDTYHTLFNDIYIDNKRLKVKGLNQFVPFQIIKDAYRSNSYDIGLAIFPESKHYYEKELTKIFEYMMAGLPVVCSNFPRWIELVERNNCGICVKPDDQQSVKSAIAYLKDNPDIRYQMGENGKRLVKEKYNWSVQEENLFRLYEKVLKNTV